MCSCADSSCTGCGSFSVPEGPAGSDGWSPQYQVVADGATREVLQLVSWTGGTGTNPGHIGEYLATAGGYTATLSLGRNIRGTNGTSGTNAFKYTKIFTTVDIEQTLTISVAEYTNCGVVPNPCILDPATINLFVDLTVTVWWRLNTTSDWLLMTAGNTYISNDYMCMVNYTTGLITITTYNSYGLYRVLITG